MACLDNMYNSEHKMSHHHHHHHHHHRHYNHNHYHNNHNHNNNNNNNQLMQVSPRISFSNDFVDAQQAMRQQGDQAARASSSRAETASSDFEFSVTSYSMMSADELFFKGRLLPFKDSNNSPNGVVSRGGGGGEGGKDDTTSSSSQRVTTLREELRQEEDDVTSRPPKGTRWKSLLGLKRAHSGSHSRKAENKAVLHEEAHVSKTSAQELMNEEMEIGI